MSVIIFGLDYYNKRHFTSLRSACSGCGRRGHLRSYDATRYFHVYWIPLLPLGRVRVLNECPHCKRMVALSHRRWQRGLNETLPAVMRRFEQHSSDPDAAREALDVAMASQDETAFLDVAMRIEKHLSDDAELLARLAHSYHQWCMDDAAESAFLASLEARDDTSVRIELAHHLMDNERTAEAAEQVAAVVADDEAKEAHVPLTASLLQSYQAIGDHEGAIAALDGLAEVQPGLAEDPLLAKLRSRSQKHVGKSVRLNTGAVVSSSSRPRPPHRAMQTLPVMLVPAVLVGLVISFVAAASDPTVEVHLVSGSTQPYAVSINGEEHELMPGNRRPLRVAAGELHVAPVDDLRFEATTLRVESPPLLERVFENTVYIINPDRLALIVWEEAEYIPEGRPVDHARYLLRLHVGDLFYEFDDVDYTFVEMPEEIELAGARAELRRGVQVHNESLGERFDWIAQELPEREIVAFLRRALEDAPDALRLLNSLAIYDPDAAAFLDSRRADRPVRTEWHRQYQMSAWQQGVSDEQLLSEYRALQQAEPEDPELMYLRGRLEHDAAERRAWYERSIESSSPSAHGFYGLSMEHLRRGEFAEALKHAERSEQLSPGNPAFRTAVDDALLAAGDYEALLARATRAWRRDRSDTDKAMRVIDLLVRLDRTGEASNIIGSHLQAVGEAGPEYEQYMRSYVDAAPVLIGNDVDAYAAMMEQQYETDPSTLMLRGRLHEAAEMIANDAAPAHYPIDHSDYVLLYALASEAGETELAEQHRIEAVQWLSRMGPADAQVAQWLEADAAPAIEQVLDLNLPPTELRSYLTALGARFAEERDTFFHHARLLNYDPSYPRMILLRVLGVDSPVRTAGEASGS